jgi:NAD(P)-dependent dehydrogenase (short-subunit alcohol dehydrogenase family)
MTGAAIASPVQQTPRGPSLGKGLEGAGVLCTGVAGGIGRVAASALAACGARVFGVDRDQGTVDEVVRALPGAGHGALGCDLANVEAAETLPDRAAEHLGNLDVLVHAAAVLRRQSMSEVAEADWDVQVDVNLKSTFFLARAAGDRMRENEGAGRIILFASQSWWTGGFGGSLVYSAAKGGVVTLTRGLAREYGAAGVTVNAIVPGAIDTPMLRDGLSDDVLAETLAATPLNRLGRPEDVSGTVAFLASEHATFITGTVINVSGGWLTY